MRKGQTKEFWWTAEKVAAMDEVRRSENLTLEETGSRYEIKKQRVQQLFKRFGIEMSSRQVAERRKAERFLRLHLIPKETLTELYVDQKIKMVDLVKILNKSAEIIRKNLDFHGIPKRGRGHNPPPALLSYDLLYEMYIEKKMTARQIAEKLGQKLGTVQMRLSFLGLKNNRFKR